MGPILIHKQMGRGLIMGSWQPDKRNVDVFISDAATGAPMIHICFVQQLENVLLLHLLKAPRGVKSIL